MIIFGKTDHSIKTSAYHWNKKTISEQEIEMEFTKETACISYRLMLHSGKLKERLLMGRLEMLSQTSNVKRRNKAKPRVSIACSGSEWIKFFW